MIRVTLFGRFSAESEKCQVSLRDGSKAQELFSYLLLGGSRAHTREAVASILWSDCSTATSKAYLRKALWQLRSALENCERTSSNFLQLNSDWIQVALERELWVDVMLFQRAYYDSCEVGADALSATTIEAMQDALKLYRDGVLPNRYETWCVEEQDRYRTMYLSMREKLMDHQITKGQHQSAIEQGKHILHCDSAHERTHQRIMWLYNAQQDRTRALNQYRACKQALAEELGVEPSRQTTDLYRAICDNAAPTFAPHDPYVPAEPSKQQHATSSFRAQLHELKSSFAELHRCAESLLSELERCGVGSTRSSATTAHPGVRTLSDTSPQRLRTGSLLEFNKPVIRS